MMKKLFVAVILNGISLAGYWYALRSSNKFLKGMVAARKHIQAYSNELFHGESKSDTDDFDISVKEVSEAEVPEEFLKAAMQAQLDNVDADDVFSLDEVNSGTWKERR